MMGRLLGLNMLSSLLLLYLLSICASQSGEEHIILYNSASACLNAHDYHCAIAEYKKALEHKNDFPQAWQNLALSYDNVAMHQEAHACHEKALEFGEALGNDFLSRVSVNYGISLIDAYGFVDLVLMERVLEILNRAVELSPTNQNALSILGKTYFSLQMNAEATATFHRLLELNPNSHMALLNMGNQHFMQSEYQEAEVYFRRAISNGASDAKNWRMAHSNLAQCLRQQEKYVTHTHIHISLSPEFGIFFR